MKIWFKSTLALSLLVLASYAWLSQGNLFIPAETIGDFSVSYEKPWNALFYSLAHVGILHLLTNLLYLAAFAAIVERGLGRRDVWTVFFSVAISGAIFFMAVQPYTGVVGSSAGIAGLIAVALLLKPKQSIAALIVIGLLSSFVGFVVSGGLEELLESREKEITRMEVDINKAIQDKNIQRAEQLKTSKEQKQGEKYEIEMGIEFEKASPANHLMHAIGAVVGLAYLIIFRKKEFEKGAKKYWPLFEKVLGK